MHEVSVANKVIAKTVSDIFGGSPRIIRYWDDARRNCVDLLSCIDCPQVGVTSFSTIGLSDHPLYKNGNEYPVRTELVGACGNSFTAFDRAISTAAFCVINSKWFASPGAIFPDILSMYKCSDTLQHLFFVPPFLWEHKLATLSLPKKQVAWLLVVPISENERKLASSEGSGELEKLFELKQIDIFNLNRPSVI
jgi:hypothetical protein